MAEHFAHLRAAASAVGDRDITVLFAEGDDERVRAAAAQVADAGWCSVGLLGSQPPPTAHDHVRYIDVAELAVDGSPTDHPSGLAAHLVAEGHFDGAVLGATTHSREVLSAGIASLTRPGRPRVAGAAWVDASSSTGRQVIFVDPSVNLRPDANTLCDALDAAAHLYERVMDEEAHIGLATWRNAESGGAELDDHAGVVALLQERNRHVVCGGPAQADALLVADVAARKGLGGAEWTPANVIGFASIETANVCTKIVEVIGGAATCAFNTGFVRPFNDVSRSSTVDGLVAVAAVTVLQVVEARTTENRSIAPTGATRA